MRKLMAVLALGAAAAAIAPAAGAFAQTEGHREYRGHFAAGQDCDREGARIEANGKADGWVCEVSQLGGFNLYMIYN
ncbi:hypothetical protein ACIA49_17715 [Kribbella sp. NPDC051587]|uniref:hypothetical protein n=1 Tax=Kribbella sp. NPDC051587 TaxID=3364119 RepID=UPI00378A609C